MTSSLAKRLVLGFVLVFLAVTFIASPMRIFFHHETFNLVTAMERGLFWSTLTTIVTGVTLMFYPKS